MKTDIYPYIYLRFEEYKTPIIRSNNPETEFCVVLSKICFFEDETETSNPSRLHTNTEVQCKTQSN